MPCFTELPPELIYNIFTYLLLPTITKRPIFWVAKLCPLDSPARREVADAYSTARALVNTCRLFRTVAQNVRLHRYEASFADVRTDVLRRLRQERHSYSRIMEIRRTGSSKIGHRCKTDRHRQTESREEIDLLHPMEATQNILYDNLAQFPAHVELALLIIKSPNLRSLCVYGSEFDLYDIEKILPDQGDPRVPVWLEAVLAAPPAAYEPLESNTILSRLQSLQLNLVTFSAGLACLFHIPSLRSLSLADCYHYSEPFYAQIRPEDWPIREPCSDIRHLQFDDTNCDSPIMITKLIGSCKALPSFTINEGADADPRDPLQCWGTLLGALGRHASTLKRLAICAPEEFMILRPEMEIARIEGFDQFHNLDHLEVPWTMLMGKPTARFSGWENAPREDWEGHPSMISVLPTGLRSLVCYNEQWAELASFYDGAFLSVLPVAATQSVALREFHFVYGTWRMGATFSWDHVQMQRRLHNGGIDFKLELRKLETEPRHRMDTF